MPIPSRPAPRAGAAAAALLLAAALPARADVQTKLEGTPGFTVFEIGLFPPLSLFSWKNPNKSVYGVDVNVFYSRTADMYGVQAGLFSRVMRNAGGIQVNVLANVVEANATSLQVSGFYNGVAGDFGGVQVTLGKNVIGGVEAGGIQIGVLKNETTASFRGIQFSPFVNEASGLQTRAIQVGGFLNWSDSNLFRGIQISACNLAWGDLSGFQIGGFNRVAKPERVDDPFYNPVGAFSGVQVGVINIGGWVRGLQIGLFNMADALSGLQLGLLNFGGKGALPFMLGINPGFAGGPN